MLEAHLMLLALSSLLSSALAINIQGRIQWNEICTKYGELGASKVVLDDGKLSGSITKDGSFVIPDVQPGTYLFSVESHDCTFDYLRVDVKSFESAPEIRPYVLGTPFNPTSSLSLPYPITLVPRSKNAYFVPRESFNLVGMFQNPMMMIMVFTGVLVFAMPYIMKNMDPEMLEDFKDRQAKMARIQNSMQSGELKSGMSALLAGDEELKVSGARAQPPSQSRNRGNKSKKR